MKLFSIRAAFSMLICVVFLFGALPVWGARELSGKDFSELTYSGYTMEMYQALYDKIAAAMEEKSESALQKCVEEYGAMLARSTDDVLLANYNWYNDIQNEELSKTYYEYANILTQAQTLLSTLSQEKPKEAEVQAELEISRLLEDYTTKMNASPDEADSAREAVGAAFIALIEARNAYAQTKGYEDYSAYYHAENRSYTLEEMDGFAAQVGEYLVPLYLELRNRADSGDLAKTEFPMDTERLLDTVSQSLERVSERLKEPLEYMLEHRLYDISVSDKKVKNFAGMVYPLRGEKSILLMLNNREQLVSYLNLAHELGHYANAYFTGVSGFYEPAYLEILSSSLVLFASEETDGFFTPQEQKKLEQDVVLHVLSELCNAAQTYRFERSVYAEKDLTTDKISAHYYTYMHELVGTENESKRLTSWLLQDTVGRLEFYQEGYALSSFTAVDLWMRYKADKTSTVDLYEQLLGDQFGNQYTEAVGKAGLNSPFVNPDMQALSTFLKASFEGETFAVTSVTAENAPEASGNGWALSIILPVTAAVTIGIVLCFKKRKPE